MNWAFALLGLTPEADAASVKRAYARLLRTTRPDEDPAAFQRLHTAYKMVLAQVSTKPTSTSHPIVAETLAAKPPINTQKDPAPPQSSRAETTTVAMAAPPVDLDVLAGEVIHMAMQSDDGQMLSSWLHAREELWSIQVKQQSGHRVLNRLFQQPRAISADCMDALLSFFDLDHVLARINPVAIQALRTKQRTLWEILPRNHRELARRIGLIWKIQPEVNALGKDIALLQKPRTWPRVLRVALQFGRVRQIGRLVHTLRGQGSFNELPPSIDREHAFFWSRAAASGLDMTWQRFIIGLMRSVLASLVCAIGLLGLLMVSSTENPPTEDDWIRATSASASVGAVILALWPLSACGVSFDQWQRQPESMPARWPWLRRLTIPGLCAIGYLLYEVGASSLGAWLVGLSFIFAIRKFRHRTAKKNKTPMRIGSMMPAFLFIAIIIGRALSQVHDIGNFPFIPATALATLCVVIADLWRHRAHLHPKLARN